MAWAQRRTNKRLVSVQISTSPSQKEPVVSPVLQVTLSGGLSFGIPLVLAVREVMAMRRRPRGSASRSRT